MNPSDAQNAKLMQMMNELQMRDSITTYNSLVIKSFEACVKDFRNNTLTDKEKKCVMRFGDKYIRFTQRVSMRFSEHQTALQLKQQQELASTTL